MGAPLRKQTLPRGSSDSPRISPRFPVKPKAPAKKYEKKFDWRAAQKARKIAFPENTLSASVSPRETEHKWTANDGSNHRYPDSKFCGVASRCDESKCWRNM